MMSTYTPASDFPLYLLFIVPILILVRVAIVNFIFRHEKLGKLIYQCDRAFTHFTKSSVKYNSWVIVLMILSYSIVARSAIFGTPRPSSTGWLWVLGFSSIVMIWKNCQRTEIRSKGLWSQGSAILWKNILAYGWNDNQDTVLVKLEKSVNLFSGHKGGDFPIPIFEGDREEVAKYFNIYLEGKEQPLTSSKQPQSDTLN